MLEFYPDYLLYLESTVGPFDRSDTVVAPWAPKVENINEVKNFLSDLRMRLDEFQKIM